MVNEWLHDRTKVLDSYIAALKAGRCDNPQRFVWEEDVPPPLTRLAYHAAILVHARRGGVKVTDDKEGFSISLPNHE